MRYIPLPLLLLVLVGLLMAPLGAQPISPRLVATNFWYQLEGKKAEALRPMLSAAGFGLVRVGGNGYNKTWPGDARVGEWVDYIRSCGAEPLIQISALQSAEQAAATVRYFNGSGSGRAPVRHWAIGNEPDLDKWPTERVHDYVLRLAAAMKSVDPGVLIFVPDLAGPHFEHLDRLVGGDLDVTGARLGDVFLVDGISWHRYAFWRDYTREEALARIEPAFHAPMRRLRALMAAADAKHGRTGGQALKWGLGEFNIHVVVKPASNPARYQSVEGIGVHSFFNGQFFAELYGVCMAEEAHFAASWSIHESGGDRGTTDFGLFDGPASAPLPRASFHHSVMVARYFSGTHHAVRHATQNIVSYASHDGDRVSVMVINKDETQSRVLSLRAGAASGAPLPDELFLETAGLAPLGGWRADVCAPALSTTVIVFGLDGVERERAVYTIAHARENRAPDIVTAVAPDTVLDQ